MNIVMPRRTQQDNRGGRAGKLVHFLIGLDRETYVRLAILAKCKHKSLETIIERMISKGLATEVAEMAERE